MGEKRALRPGFQDGGHINQDKRAYGAAANRSASGLQTDEVL
jgi:hypothetical protein